VTPSQLGHRKHAALGILNEAQTGIKHSHLPWHGMLRTEFRREWRCKRCPASELLAMYRDRASVPSSKRLPLAGAHFKEDIPLYGGRGVARS
jgi:hypothetical protein